MSATLATVQAEHAEWLRAHFSHLSERELRHLTLIGAVEELGELARAHLKAAQAVDPGPSWEAKGRDAVGDVLVFLCGYCTARGWDVESVLAETWATVKERRYVHGIR